MSKSLLDDDVYMHGPFMCPPKPDKGVQYKVLVTVNAKGRYTIQCQRGLKVTVNTLEELPETLRWNLICVLTKDMKPLSPKAMKYSMFMDLLWTPNLYEVDAEWQGIGWRVTGSEYVIVTPEQELLDVSHKYMELETCPHPNQK
jgi:hypothetical protein